MKKIFEGLTKTKLLGVLALCAILTGTMIASAPSVVADTTTSILYIVRNIQTIVQSIQSTVQGTNTNLNKVKVETVIQGPWMNTSGFTFPKFNITANQPWDLMAIYISTQGVSRGIANNETVDDKLVLGIYYIGGRLFFAPSQIIVADGEDVTNFPIFAGDMTNATQSIIVVPPNVPVIAEGLSLTEHDPAIGFLVSFKIVIQKPIDPNFSYNVTWG